MWKNIVEPDRPQMAIWRMRIACWITNATNTHSEYVILIAYPLQQWLHERALVLRYMYIACRVSSPVRKHSLVITERHCFHFTSIKKPHRTKKRRILRRIISQRPRILCSFTAVMASLQINSVLVPDS